jgi:hypothetical protein
MSGPDSDSGSEYRVYFERGDDPPLHKSYFGDRAYSAADEFYQSLENDPEAFSAMFCRMDGGTPVIIAEFERPRKEGDDLGPDD